MRKIFCWLLIPLFVSSCKEYAYFQSPMLTNTSGYKTIPLKSQQQPSATYASGAISYGDANDNGRDRVRCFNGAVHRSHNMGAFQAFYGVTGTLGEYTIRPVRLTEWNSFSNLNLNDSLINAQQGGKFFGSYGLTGGVNLVLPLSHGGEWRVVGAEFSWNQEFGKYFDFRKQLPDTAANLIDKRRAFFTLGISTDILIPVARKGSFGLKIAQVYSLRNLKGYDDQKKPITHTPQYFSGTLHLTINRVTGFYQVNIGSYATGMQFGTAVRIGR